MHRHRLAFAASLAILIPLTGCTSGTDDNNTTAAQTDEIAAGPDDSMIENDTDLNTAAASPSLQPVELATIRRAHRFGDIYLTGQPSQDDFFAVRDAGIRTIINQRHDRENAEFSEQQVVTELGMMYESLPFGAPAELTDELLDATRMQFRDAPKPMLIHCASANRTGATWLAYAVLDRGLSIEEATAEAKMVGLSAAALEDVVLDYIQRRQAEE